MRMVECPWVVTRWSEELLILEWRESEGGWSKAFIYSWSSLELILANISLTPCLLYQVFFESLFLEHEADSVWDSQREIERVRAKGLWWNKLDWIEHNVRLYAIRHTLQHSMSSMQYDLTVSVSIVLVTLNAWWSMDPLTVGHSCKSTRLSTCQRSSPDVWCEGQKVRRLQSDISNHWIIEPLTNQLCRWRKEQAHTRTLENRGAKRKNKNNGRRGWDGHHILEATAH